MAWVSTSNSGGSTFTEWNTPGSGYYEVIRNLALNSGASVDVVQTSGLASGSTFPVGITVNTFVATDAAGNSCSCSFTVTVQDNSSPTLLCLSDTTIATTDGGTGDCEGILTFDVPIPGDECGFTTYTIRYINPDGTEDGPFNVEYSLKNFSDTSITRSFDLGVSTVELAVEDPSGNSASCSFTVTVEDNEDPTFVNCPSGETFMKQDLERMMMSFHWD